MDRERARLPGSPDARSGDGPHREAAVQPVAQAMLTLQRQVGNAAAARLAPQMALQRLEIGAVTSHPMVRQGSSGESVKVAQIKLNLCGAEPALTNFGKFDEATTKATQAFQRRHGLNPDGVIGPKTWGALDDMTWDVGTDEQDIAWFNERMVEANALRAAGLDDEALKILDELYADRRVSPEMRHGLTFKMATIHHRQGRFDLAISLYQEFLELIGMDSLGRRDGLQRIREARQKQMPGILESDVANRTPSPGVESDAHPTVQQGSSGDSVKSAQIKLNLCGAEPALTNFAKFDEATTKATQAFQRRHGLNPDGVIGPKTWGALDDMTWDVGTDEQDIAWFNERMVEANALRAAGLDDEALKILDELYADRRVSPEMRHGLTFKMATIHHRQGRFDLAISLYQEFLELIGMDSLGRRDGLQRIREARQKQMPGILESDVANRTPSPGVESDAHPTVQQGSSGDSVKSAQIKLNLCGAEPALTNFAKFDEPTTKATQAFQRRHGLNPDGVIGPKTWGALDDMTWDVGTDEQDIAWFNERMVEANALRAAGLDDEALKILDELYADRRVSPEMRHGLTFKMATIHHRQGRFDLAISLYQEFLELIGMDSLGRRDGLQRIREARQKQMPGILESDVANRRLASEEVFL